MKLVYKYLWVIPFIYILPFYVLQRRYIKINITFTILDLHMVIERSRITQPFGIKLMIIKTMTDFSDYAINALSIMKKAFSCR